MRSGRAIYYASILDFVKDFQGEAAIRRGSDMSIFIILDGTPIFSLNKRH